jgi:hypothetical protein
MITIGDCNVLEMASTWKRDQLFLNAFHVSEDEIKLKELSLSACCSTDSNKRSADDLEPVYKFSIPVTTDSLRFLTGSVK